MGEQSDYRDGDARQMDRGLRAKSSGRDTSEPLSSNEEAETWPSFGADAFVTTLFSGTPADVSEKTWWLFRTLARESTTDFQLTPTGETFQLPRPPWSSTPSGCAPSNASTTQQTTSAPGIRVPTLHFKQDAFNFIKRNLESSFKETGDAVMATIGCLMFLEAASWETNPDALPAVVMHLNGLVTATNHHCGPVVTAELTILQKFLGMAVGCVTRHDMQEQLSSIVSSVNQCLLRCLLFIGQSSKPTEAWWCVDEDKSTNSDRRPPSFLTRARGQQDPRFTNARMIAYLYLSLVLRPGRMSDEVLECLIDSIGTDSKGAEQHAINNSAEQAALFWSFMLSRAAFASITPLYGRDPEKLYWKQRLVDQNMRNASATLQLQAWPEAVAVLRKVAFVEFEGEQELKSMWEGAVSDVYQ